MFPVVKLMGFLLLCLTIDRADLTNDTMSFVIQIGPNYQHTDTVQLKKWIL